MPNTTNQHIDYRSMTLRERREALREQIHRFGPEHFFMGVWYRRHENDLIDWDTGMICHATPEDALSACGSAACLAGHMSLLTGVASIETLTAIFGIPTIVFYPSEWGCVRMPTTETNSADESFTDRLHRHLESRLRDGQHTPADLAESQWHTVLDYLDVLIKEDA